VGLEWDLLSLMSTIEELLGRNSSGSSLEMQEYGCRDSLCWLHGIYYTQKLAQTSPTRGGFSVSIVCSWTKTTIFFYKGVSLHYYW
jgi:hypothetical protein